MKEFNAKDRALTRSEYLVETESFIKRSVLPAEKKDDRLRCEEKHFLADLFKDEDFMSKAKFLNNLLQGGCGDVEEEVCKKDGKNYCAENCKACQEEYLSIQDAALDKKQKEAEDEIQSGYEPASIYDDGYDAFGMHDRMSAAKDVEIVIDDEMEEELELDNSRKQRFSTRRRIRLMEEAAAVFRSRKAQHREIVPTLLQNTK